MASTILLIRHAITQSNLNEIYQGRSEEDVTPEGYLQIDQLCKRLKNTPIATVYSSPLKRARTTASCIAKDKYLPLEIREELKEIDLGLWEGLTKEEICQKWPEIWAQLLFDPGKIVLPKGESFKEVIERSVRVFEELIHLHTHPCIAIVTHDIIIKILVLYVLKVPTSAYHRFQIDCASITKITSLNNSHKLISLNDTFHLN